MASSRCCTAWTRQRAGSAPWSCGLGRRACRDALASEPSQAYSQDTEGWTMGAFNWRQTMPIFISRGKFTSDAVKGMLAKPENREEVVANLYKSVGGKLIGWYLTFGSH